jgi:C1A family cysteine protease
MSTNTSTNNPNNNPIVNPLQPPSKHIASSAEEQEYITDKGFGYVPDVPDFRDKYYQLTGPVLPPEQIPPKKDLRETGFFNFPVLDQGNLGSCTANAISAAITYTMLKQGKTTVQNIDMGMKPPGPTNPTGYFSPSRLFIYYNERVMEHSVNSDAGAMLRDGIKSVNKQGACKESTWPYIIQQFTMKPSAQAYQEAMNYQAIQYSRLINTDINQLKQCIVQGFPFVFGFSVYQSFMSRNVANTGIVPMPNKTERLLGGHAVLAVGYDDAKKVFIVRNSWGDRWGDKGYFYMPYAYITNADLAADFWTITMME